MKFPHVQLETPRSLNARRPQLDLEIPKGGEISRGPWVSCPREEREIPKSVLFTLIDSY